MTGDVLRAWPLDGVTDATAPGDHHPAAITPLTTLLRLFWTIPIAVIASLVSTTGSVVTIDETGEVVDERPLIRIFNSCKGFWRTVPGLREDPKNIEDVDTKQEDHLYDCLRYMCQARPVRPKKSGRIPASSFQATRTKLIRARKYAARHGVSLDVAYTRVR